MRRTKLMVICYLSLSICAQAGSLTQEENSAFKGLHKELLRIENELLRSHQELVRQSQDFDCMRLLHAIHLMDCLSSLEDDFYVTYKIVDQVNTLADLSGSMVAETDEARIDREVLLSINFGIKQLSIERNAIQKRHCIGGDDVLFKSEQLLRLVERAVDLLTSAKRHFEP